MAYFKFEHKRIFYKILGEGEPVILLHGNTVSSKMFNSLLKKYAEAFKVILIDFPGHGKSERLDKFETDFWFYNSTVTHALIQELQLEEISVVGTSGGALVAINLALMYPEKINYLVADSFEGEYPLPSYIHSLKTNRKKDKKKLLAKLFWFNCHGFGWSKIVDLDTEMNIEFARTGKSFFHKPIAELQTPTILTGSQEDEYCSYLDKIYGKLKEKNEHLEIHLFEKGKHPAMLSNKDAFFEFIKSKFNESNQRIE